MDGRPKRIKKYTDSNESVLVWTGPKAISAREHRDWLKFRKHRNFVNQIKAAKEEYYCNAFHENEGNIRNTWRVINELTS